MSLHLGLLTSFQKAVVPQQRIIKTRMSFSKQATERGLTETCLLSN